MQGRWVCPLFWGPCVRCGASSGGEDKGQRHQTGSREQPRCREGSEWLLDMAQLGVSNCSPEDYTAHMNLWWFMQLLYMPAAVPVVPETCCCMARACFLLCVTRGRVMLSSWGKPAPLELGFGIWQGSLCFFASEGVVKIHESLFIFKGLGRNNFEQDRKTHEGTQRSSWKTNLGMQRGKVWGGQGNTQQE